MSKIFKVDAQGDTVYISAPDLASAQKQLREKIGHIPSSLLTFTEVKELPKGEEYL